MKTILGVGCLIAAFGYALLALGDPYFWFPLVSCAACFALTGCYLIAKGNSKFSTKARCFMALWLCLLLGDIFLSQIPWFVRARYTRSEQACVNNLRQIEGAKEQWAIENHKTNGVVTEDDVRPYLGRGVNGSLPKCPAGGTYVIGRVGEDPGCTVGYSAWPNEHVLNPTNSWWNNFKSTYVILFGLNHAEKP